MEETVVVKLVSDEPEAQIVCGLLRSAGIECGYRETDEIAKIRTTLGPRCDSTLEDFSADGPREIHVHPSDLEAARALLAG